MACPYFMPVEKLENGAWLHPSRLPLGGGWRGYCTAPGHEGENPTQDVLETSCNLGYAGCCSWVPLSRSWDAVRFAIISPREARQPSRAENVTTILRIHFVCEREHRPQAHGELEFDLVQSIWLQTHEDSRIQKMAECFLASFLQKKG
jgi:hypothetical protein